MRARISRMQSGPAASGSANSVSLNFTLRSEGKISSLHPMRSPSRPATDSGAASVGWSAFISQRSVRGRQKNSK